jgi:hypothetical protein
MYEVQSSDDVLAVVMYPKVKLVCFDKHYLGKPETIGKLENQPLQRYEMDN